MRSPPGPPLDPREQDLCHLTWILHCLDPGASWQMHERRFASLFGSLSANAFDSANEFARERGCIVVYNPYTKVIRFQRMSPPCMEL
jgi:hypothetical protein